MFIKFENLQFKIYNLKFSICNGDLSVWINGRDLQEKKEMDLKYKKARVTNCKLCNNLN